MGELACQHCGAHLPVPFWKWSGRLPDGGGPCGTVRCGACGWRYEVSCAGREWSVVAGHPPVHVPDGARVDWG
jgi:hypothetical protein